VRAVRTTWTARTDRAYISARFLGLPLSRNQADITNAVCDVLSQLGTDLVLVDEIYNLNCLTCTAP
jgi:hypothetical protein